MPGQIGTSIRANTRRIHSGDRESDAIDDAGLAQARERFALLFRMAWRSQARLPSLPADLPTIQIMAARATQYLLYALLLVQPVLGLLHSIALGARIDLFFLIELPAMMGRDKVLSKMAISAHDLVANLMLVVVALHATAALFHHFVRRDGVMKGMLPGARF